MPTGIKVVEKYWDATTKLIRANGTPDVGKDNKHIKMVLGGLNDRIKSLYIRNGEILPTIAQLNATYEEAAAALTRSTEAETAPVTVLEALRTFLDEHVDWAPATQK